MEIPSLSVCSWDISVVRTASVHPGIHFTSHQKKGSVAGFKGLARVRLISKTYNQNAQPLLAHLH